MAVKARLWVERDIIRPVGGTDTIFTYPHIILERSEPWSFTRRPFGSPGEHQYKNRLEKLSLRLQLQSGKLVIKSYLLTSHDPWNLAFELASDSSFKNVLYRRSKRIQMSPLFSTSFTWQIPYKNISSLRKHEKLYYRAMRKFDDGDCTDWTLGEDLFEWE